MISDNQEGGIEIKSLKKYLPFIAVIILGLLVAGGAFYYLHLNLKDKVELKTIVSVNKNLNIYHEIEPEDIRYIKISKDMDTSNYYSKKEEIVGKLTKEPLFKENLIPKESLDNDSIRKNIEFITIRTDYAKTSGARPGDIVDIYRVNKEEGLWVMGRGADLVTTDAVVVNITNKYGETGSSESSIPLKSISSNIEVIKLAVNKGQAKYLAPGSVDEQNGYVLVVK